MYASQTHSCQRRLYKCPINRAFTRARSLMRHDYSIVALELQNVMQLRVRMWYWHIARDKKNAPMADLLIRLLSTQSSRAIIGGRPLASTISTADSFTRAKRPRARIAPFLLARCFAVFKTEIRAGITPAARISVKGCDGFMMLLRA